VCIVFGAGELRRDRELLEILVTFRRVALSRGQTAFGTGRTFRRGPAAHQRHRRAPVYKLQYCTRSHLHVFTIPNQTRIKKKANLAALRSNLTMSELAFCKSFLTALDARPAKLSSDHIADARQYPAQGAVCFSPYSDKTSPTLCQPD
jgi:hypothetical protein